MENRTVLYAGEGMMLTNGKVFGKVIYLADGMSESEYYGITEAEAVQRMNPEAATEEDYQNALSEMGVAL